MTPGVNIISLSSCEFLASPSSITIYLTFFVDSTSSKRVTTPEYLFVLHYSSFSLLLLFSSSFLLCSLKGDTRLCKVLKIDLLLEFVMKV
jgi:hypothetical protein